MKKYAVFILFVAFTLAAVCVHELRAAEVALPCSDCGPVSIPANDESKGVVLPGSDGMPPAGQAGSAPGGPIEAPSTPNTDPVAPNEPPPPSSD
jgi:hypothetical protein